MGIVLASAHHIVRARDLKIENVTLSSSHTVGDFLLKLFRGSGFATPVRKQVRSKHASIVVIARLKLACLLEECALFGLAPVKVLSHVLLCDVPLRTFRRKLRSLFEKSLSFRGALPE